MSIRWDNYEVVEDYRLRMIVDYDSPILAVKANRDRYTNPTNQSRYAGLAYLGSSRSEDAIAWNVFRSLQKTGRLDIITHTLDLGEPRGLLLWALAPELDGNNAKLQYVTGALLRQWDGISPGPIPEPDVIILGTTGVAVVAECNLPEQKETGRRWEGDLDRVNQLRMGLKTYEANHPAIPQEDTTGEKKNPGILKAGTTDEQMAPVYQLVRTALCAKELGAHFGVKPVAVALANSRKWTEKVLGTGKSASDLWDVFVEMLGEDGPQCERLFWQDLARLLANEALEEPRTYLLTHPWLYEVGPIPTETWYR